MRLLLVEDVEHDALLMTQTLRRGGFELVAVERVETAEAMADALTREWDAIIADYSLPGFSAPAALAMVKARRIDVPFLIVSGTASEDVAVEVIRAGAHDFMSKGNLARLVTALERELRDAQLRRERAAIQEQLLVASRMASMGLLAAGVAHEINNPLAALMANVDFASEELRRVSDELAARPEVGPDVVARLREIDEPLRDAAECAARVRHIVKDLKLFSRDDEDRVSVVDLHRVLESAIRMAWNEIRHRARLVKDYGAPPLVEGSEARLGQVFLNLLVNAAQAIPEGEAERNEIRVITRRDAGGDAVIEIRDTGSGMPVAVADRAFDAFFTTKMPEEGTGLGLAICHRIVISTGGTITLESEVDRGTTVRVVLPKAAAGGPRRASSHHMVAPIRRGRVLVVDDEPAVGTAVARMLSHEHEVVVATSAARALERVAGGERFDVVLCDLLMPDGTGMDLHASIARVDAKLADRIVFMTGGAFTPFARDFLNAVPNLRLEKPFDTTDVRGVVQSVLAW